MTEEDLTFLDDVPETEVESFLEMLEMCSDDGPRWWAFSDGNKAGPKLEHYGANQFEEVAEYFRYIQSKHG